VGPDSSSTPAPSPAPRRKRLGLGLSVEELAQLVAATGDPILAAELARRTAPPAPPGPSPQVLPTCELLAQLPGRHDWIGAATQRLAAETGEFQAASWSFFQRAVEAVVTRRVAPEVLLSCHRQATGPQAKSPGKVFVTAWKRETCQRC
jgi:hypothetical protein